MPAVKAMKYTVPASAAAASASPPSRPMKARSVVIIAIWPSCCAAIGVASRSVSISSAMRWPRGCFVRSRVSIL